MTGIGVEFAKYDSRQKLGDQARIILKKGWFSDLEIPEICGYVNSEEYEQEPPTWIETLNSEKQKPSTRIETQNQSTTDLSASKPILTPETGKKTTLPSFRHQDWKKLR